MAGQKKLFKMVGSWVYLKGCLEVEIWKPNKRDENQIKGSDVMLKAMVDLLACS